MKRSTARAWAKYLEAPNRRQAYGYLQQGRGRCCLGHACAMLRMRPKKLDAVGLDAVYAFGGEMYELPEDARHALDIEYSTGKFFKPIVVNGKRYKSLAECNDGIGDSTSEQVETRLTLKQIAKIIRKEWKNL